MIIIASPHAITRLTAMVCPFIFPKSRSNLRLSGCILTTRAPVPAGAPDFHGTVSGIEARSWSVSAIETYLDCPFKFFAQHVLKLEEINEGFDRLREGVGVRQVIVFE